METWAVKPKTVQENKLGRTEIIPNNRAPIVAAAMAGMPKQKTICQSMLFLIMTVLKILFARCTIADAITAVVGEKKMAKAGKSTVPSPKPEKKDNIDAAKATKPINKNATKYLYVFACVLTC